MAVTPWLRCPYPAPFCSKHKPYPVAFVTGSTPLEPGYSRARIVSEIVVSIPATGEFVHVLRSVIASIAALRNLPYDDIDDLRIAVDEACAHLLTIRSPASAIRLRISPSSAAIEVVASTDAQVSEWPASGAEQTLTWQVLAALADEAVFERESDHPAIRFAKRVGISQ